MGRKIKSLVWFLLSLRCPFRYASKGLSSPVVYTCLEFRREFNCRLDSRRLLVQVVLAALRQAGVY